MNISFVELTGFIGAILLVTAFFFITSGRWTSKTLLYQAFNTAAGALLAYYTWEKSAYFAAAINLIWMTVAMVGLWRIVKDAEKRSA